MSDSTTRAPDLDAIRRRRAGCTETPWRQVFGQSSYPATWPTTEVRSEDAFVCDTYDRVHGEGKGAIEDQVVLGVWKRLDPRLRWAVGDDGNPRAWTLWSFALATMGWSAGDGGCARHVNDHADALAAIEEPLRWGAFCRLASVEDDAGRKHKQDEYSALRTCQKLSAALLAAEFTGEWAMARAWLDDGLGAERGAVYARLVEVST